MGLVSESTFDNLLQNKINITPAQITQGSTSQNYIRDLLGNKHGRDAWFPRLIDGDFLSGSYARGTKLFPLNDIDIMIVIDGIGLQAMNNGLVLNAEVRGSNEPANPILNYLDANGLLNSQIVLQLFQNALSQSHPDSKVSKDGQAINVTLQSGIGIDVVPCFHIVPRDGSRDLYYIPAGYQSGGWKMTNPKIDKIISDNLHARHNEKLKPLIKLIKYWNEQYNGGRIRSYHLETIAWYIFHNYPGKINHYAIGLMYFFQKASAHLINLCPDATGIGDHIDYYLSPLDRSISIQNIESTKKILIEHYMAGLANEQKQITGWRHIYGNTFGQ